METFTHDGLTFDVTDSGPDGGDVVVLLHGFPQDSTAWAEVTPILNAAGLRTLAPDQRGYSPGATPSGRAAYSMQALVGDIVALIDASGAAKVHLVGHDWGGAVAWGLARAHPDRLKTLTVCSTPHPRAMAWAFTHGDQARKSLYMLGFQVPWVAEQVVHRRLLGLYRSLGMPEDRAAEYARRFATPQSLTGPLNWYRGMPASSAMFSSARKLLPGGAAPVPNAAVPNAAVPHAAAPKKQRADVPTTYVWGSRDSALGRAAAEKTAEFVRGDYRFVELDENHWLPEVKPQEVADAILERVHSVS
ncbi:MAG: alpha/beta hydrolase [Allobranchiibius sp.]